MIREAFIALAIAGPAVAQQKDDLEFFEKRVRPVLVEHCYDCHGPEKQKGGLRVDSKAALAKGGDNGAALVPHDAEKSLLIQAVRYTDKDMAMPPSKDGSKKLPASVIADLETWVNRGAADPRNEEAGAIAKPAFDYATERKKWAFQNPQRPVPPKVAQAEWVRTPVDAFVLAKLEASALPPAAPADARTLVRRMTFDLTGLPPTVEEVRAFEEAVARDRGRAVSELVERLLASPAYGERWARHWLDVVRYADSIDSRGSGEDGDIVDAWRYRDWVVEAFNKDLPYDQFVAQQIAGDLLAHEQWDPAKVIATSVFAIGNWGNGDSDKHKVYTDIVDDQVDVVGRAFLGLTVACARCHDHKFDPISTADYYALAGFFFSSHILEKFQPPTNGEKLMRIPLESPQEKKNREGWKRQLAAVEEKLKGGLQPLTEFVPKVAGKDGLLGLKPKTVDNPSLVMNTTDQDQAFITIKLPPRAIALHPGPQSPASLSWRAPKAGTYSVRGRLRDVDPNCGDGIEWLVRGAGTTLASGTMGNGGEADLPTKQVMVREGELVQLAIRPRGEYTCDSTQVEFVVSSGSGRTWDVREVLTRATGTVTQPIDEVWWVGEGEGDRLSEDRADLRELKAERDRLRAQLAPPPMTQGLQEGGIPGTAYAGFHHARIHVRGRYDRLGEVQPRGFPAIFAAQPPTVTGSGRLALAKWVANAENPLTARVMANRVWQHHFWEGIVRTPNNFGKLGEAPTHPDLLDWLAREFIESGWSVKHLHRLILLSSAYQQSSRSELSGARDPDNRLFGRQHRRRLSAEELRDALLAVSGTLDRKIGGPAVRDLNSARRTLYLTTIRSDRATYQMLFDGADPTGIVEKRTDSVIAPQALWLLNHPFASAQAAALARLAKTQGGQEADAVIRWLFERLYGRQPTPEETGLISPLLEPRSERAWERLAHVLLCANEFIYLD